MVSKIIAWIKSHLTLVICCSLGVISLVLVVLGFMMPTAQADLEADRQVYTSLTGVAGKAANEQTIEQIRTQQNEVRRSVQRFLAEAAKTNPHTLLNNDVFPTIKEPFAPTVFKAKSDQKRKELLALLNAKDKPSQRDIDDYNIELQKEKHKKLMKQGGAAAANAANLGAVTTPGAVAGSAGNLEKLTPEELIKQDARAGAAVKRAHEVYCYAVEEALDPRNQIAKEQLSSPDALELMWEAQLSLWIQEDLIQVLARLNNDAANALSSPADRWVGNLPIKRLMYVSVGSYLRKVVGPETTKGAGVLIDVSSPAPPAPTADSAFTVRNANESRDVVHVSLGLVIDASYLLRVLDEIGKIGFYTPLSVSYEAMEPDPLFQEYVYGAASTIRVRIELEHCILRDKLMVGDKKYLDLMPERIKTGAYLSDSARTGATGREGAAPGQYFAPTPGLPAEPRGGGRFRRGG